MKIEGEVWLPLERQRVWQGLNDPAVLKDCIHACERLEWVGPDLLEATVAVKLSIAKVRFHGTIRLSDVVPAEQYVLNGEGRGIAGAASGLAHVRLSDADGGTRLAYRAEAAAGGKLADFGHAWIDKAGRKLVERFFQRFQARIEEGSV
ncbi:carbon monoxide dehydrogenase subunit G [Aureimonas altamirensis]|uniref:CoxG family protein n=1 Tax=Aureimonas altamirensis TaxID=370622 RepID=UPI002037498F|nr:carbon monoxide dehydrogenase subunit G [Aureimonas altamirensis]MCM2502306.1 carbon monoxide dehydrogenase subunit G [Aureimonas altamirensis]